MHNTFSRSDDTVASFSSKGPTLIDHVVKPDIVAPGNRVVSLFDPIGTLEATYPKFDIFPCIAGTSNCTANVGAAMYYRLSGTSMATPVVSGAAALMIQKDPTLTPDIIKARMMKTAFKGFASYSSSLDANGRSYQNQDDVFTYGAGYLDIAAALNSSDTGTGHAVSPTAVYDPVTGTVSLVFANNLSILWGSDTSILWGSSVLWSSSVVWGSNVFVGGTSVLWGSSVIWGSSTTTGFSVLWGSTTANVASGMTAMSDADPGDCDPDDSTCLLTTDPTSTTTTLTTTP
jgi:serine protease AprX